MHIRRRTALTGLALAVFAFALVLSALFIYEPEGIGSDTRMFSTIYWQEQIRTHGPKQAYQDLVHSVEDMAVESARAHTYAHIFGEALYRVAGIAGISACGRDFAYGCFHEFLGQAIAEHGIDVVKRIETHCRQATRQIICQHGIGHGLVSYLGYSETNLDRALELCDTLLPKSDPVGGCYGGVFMEYNLRFMAQTGELYNPRTLSGGMHAPCDTIADAYRSACYFRLPQWWAWALFEGKLNNQTAAVLGRYCRQAATLYQNTCFQGIGRIGISLLDFDTLRAVAICGSAADTSRHDGLCRAQAVVTKGVVVGVTDVDLSVCNTLDSTGAQACRALLRTARTQQE